MTQEQRDLDILASVANDRPQYGRSQITSMLLSEFSDLLEWALKLAIITAIVLMLAH